MYLKKNINMQLMQLSFYNTFKYYTVNEFVKKCICLNKWAHQYTYTSTKTQTHLLENKKSSRILYITAVKKNNKYSILPYFLAKVVLPEPGGPRKISIALRPIRTFSISSGMPEMKYLSR